MPADAILVLDSGKVLDTGHHKDLLGRCDLYRRLWRQQNLHSLAGAAE